MQSLQRQRQEFRIVHWDLFHSGTPVFPRFRTYESPKPQRLSEEQPGYRQAGAGMIPWSDLTFRIVSSSRCQLLEIARGLSYMHDLGIVHGNVKIVRPILVL